MPNNNVNMNIRVSIVEDEDAPAERLKSFLERFSDTEKISFSVSHFKSADIFLKQYEGNSDIVFMDIELPEINGMDAAFKLRKVDENVVIFFVTNLAQFAVKGYEIEAFDYMLKPIEYTSFAIRLKKALKIVEKNIPHEITLSKTNGFEKININDIYYIEVIKHKVIYHTVSGEIPEYVSMKSIEDEVGRYGFLRCNNCYLVNRNHITKVHDYSVIMRNGDSLLISHPRKKQFMLELNKWIGEGNI